MIKDNLFTDIMLDVETLGNLDQYVVTQIAMVPFNLHSGLIGDKEDSFCEHISLSDSIKHNLLIEPGTLQWWLKQDETIFHKQVAGKLTIKEVMDKLTEYLCHTNGSQCTFWATSPLDYQSINTLSRIAKQPAPICYKNKMCARTIRYLWEHKTGQTFVSKNTHDAYQDCVFQIKDIMNQMKSIYINE